jgi:hypothetical protein
MTHRLHRAARSLALAALTALPLAATPSPAQTNSASAPPPALAAPPLLAILTNLPATSLGNERLSVCAGTVMRGTTSFENSLSARCVVRTNFAFAAEIQDGPSSSVVDSFGLQVQVRKAWNAAEVYALMGGRRNWPLRKWEGVAGLGASWQPMPQSTRIAVFAEQRIIAGALGSQPQTETVAGIRCPF